MADEKQGTKATPAKPAKAKRHILTTEERIAKAEADLAALRDKAQAGDRKRLAVVDEKIGKLTGKRDELNTQLTALASEKQSIEARLAPATDEKPKG